MLIRSYYSTDTPPPPFPHVPNQQENNAVMKVDIKGCRASRLYALGYKVGLTCH